MSAVCGLGGVDGGGEDGDAGFSQAREAVFSGDGEQRKTLPAEERTALGFQALTVPGRVRTPVAPKASAERRMAPRLPGSWRLARTRSRGGVSRWL